MPTTTLSSRKPPPPSTKAPAPSSAASLQQRQALLALQSQADTACRLLKTMANPDRLLILCQLLGTELAVLELASATGVPQPTLSQQLAVLRDEGLVSTRREGKFIYYRLASAPVQAVLQTLHDIYCKPTSSRH